MVQQSLSAESDNALDLLNDYIQSLDTYQAVFSQTIFGQNGQQVDMASGTVSLQKPGKFYWAYQEPYSQELISDGNNLWVYDVDLEQVTINDMDLTHNNSPAAILSGNVDLSSHYSVSDLGEFDGYRWIELEPLESEQEFSAVRLGFKEIQLSGMVLFDNLGQTTVIQFEDISTNKEITPQLFHFQVPENIDVIDSRLQ